MKSTLVAALILLYCLTFDAASQAVEVLDLGGRWQLHQQGATDTVPAQVPGNVHLDLLSAGKIADEFYRDNAERMKWIGDSTWVYERNFEMPPADLARDVVLLRCEGLDTVARIEVNGKQLADTDNMHRTWEFDIKPLLQAGSNRIRITFSPIEPYIDAFTQRAPKVPNSTGLGLANIRKSSYSNGWDFCYRYMPCGIYKPISIVSYDNGRIQDVSISQDLTDAKNALLQVAITASLAEAESTELTAEAVVQREGHVVDRQKGKISNTTANVELEIANPLLWWPNGMGEQPLYDVTVELQDAAGAVIDSSSRRIGLRTVELLSASADQPLRLAVNDREIFAKGANWVPPDVFPARAKESDIRQRIADAAAVNMNMLRVWGGGYYPEDAFFDACDEMGIMVWSDFMFACAAYPGNNPEFQANVRAEITDQVRRLRHHPSIAVWCGNNEVIKLITDYRMITRPEYDRLFHEVIGTEVERLFPQANYVGGSPEAGDEHNWWVWHVGADFEHYRDSHGWMTEFGFQSFPAPATVNSYTQPQDRDSIFSDINRFHQRNGIGDGNKIMHDKLLGYFREPKDFESTLWLSQILQAQGMATGIEHWRTDWPHSSGALVWQFNDCWPGPTWASVDYYGRWKAAQYVYRRVFAPLLISGVVQSDSDIVPTKIASELAETTEAVVRWRLIDLHGNTLVDDHATLSLPAGTASTAGPRIDVSKYLDQRERREVLLRLDIVAGDFVAENVITFTRPKELQLQEPKLAFGVANNPDQGFDVTITSKTPALWTWLECSDPDARYSDNFIHLFPDAPRVIHVTPSRSISIDDFRQGLQARSLFDTYASP